MRDEDSDDHDMAESIQAAASGIQSAMGLLDDSARRQVEPVRAFESERQQPAAQTETVRHDLAGQPLKEMQGYIFAPGYVRADERGLVPWPSFDPSVDRFIARRSVEANAVVIRQARQAYESITAMGTSGDSRRG